MPSKAQELSIHDIVVQLEELGVSRGNVLLVHTSFRAVRPVEQGPHSGLWRPLPAALVSQAHWSCPPWTGGDDELFDPKTTPSDPDLGVVADTFWRLPGVARACHPMAFAARGPKAEEILADPLVLPPHQQASPVGRVLDHDGKILLIGCDYDANTTIHLAELLAGVPLPAAKAPYSAERR